MLINDASEAAELIAKYGGASERPAMLLVNCPTHEQLEGCRANVLFNVERAFNLLRQYHTLDSPGRC